MTRGHTRFRAFLESLQAQDLTKTSKNNTSKKCADITKTRERGWWGGMGDRDSTTQLKTKIDY